MRKTLARLLHRLPYRLHCPGPSISIYTLAPDSAAAIADAVDWVARTQLDR